MTDYERLDELLRAAGRIDEHGDPVLRRGRAPNDRACSRCAGSIARGEEVLFDRSYLGAHHVDCRGRDGGRLTGQAQAAAAGSAGSQAGASAARRARPRAPRPVTIEDVEQRMTEVA